MTDRRLSVAEKANLLSGYKLISIDEYEDLKIEEYIEIIRDNPNMEMKFVFLEVPVAFLLILCYFIR